MKKLITFLMVITFLSFYAIPKVTKAFSFRDLLPNFSVRTDAQITTVDTTTKDSAIKDSKAYTDSKFNSFNYNLNSLENNFGGLESRFNSLESDVKKLEKPSTYSSDTDYFVLNPLQEDLDLGGYNIGGEGNIDIVGDITSASGAICDISGCIGDSSDTDYFVLNPLQEDLNLGGRSIIGAGDINTSGNICGVNGCIGDSSFDYVNNPMTSELIANNYGINLLDYLTVVDDDNFNRIELSGTEPTKLFVQTPLDNETAILGIASGSESYAGEFIGNVKIHNYNGNTYGGNLQVGSNNYDLIAGDNGQIQAKTIFTENIYVRNLTDLANGVTINGGLNVYGPGPMPEDEAPFNLAADFIGSVKIKSNLQVGPDSSGLMPSDGGIKAINMYTSGMYISGGLQVSAMSDNPVSIASNFSGTTQFNDLVKFYDNVSIYNGNLGIGTYSPNKQLHIKTSNNEGNAEIDIQSGYNNHWGIYQEVDGGDLKFWHVNDRVVFTDEGIETNKIDLEEVCLNGVCIDNWRDLQRMLNINY